MSDDTAGGLAGCGCAILWIGLSAAAFILCVGAAWKAVAWAWGWSFG